MKAPLFHLELVLTVYHLLLTYATTLDFTGTADLAAMGRFRQMLVKYQAWLFLPALFTVSLGLQYHSFTFLLRKKAKYHALEWVLMLKPRHDLGNKYVQYCLQKKSSS